MQKMTKAELFKIFMEFNREHENGAGDDELHGVIVYKESNWPVKYSLESRSYRVSSRNRAFQEGKIANSIFGSSLDGKDNGVRLDWYHEWEVDYCYLEKGDELNA